MGKSEECGQPGRVRIGAVSEADLPAVAHLAGIIWRAHYPGIISQAQIEYMLEKMYDLVRMGEELRSGVVYAQIRVGEQMVGFAAYGPDVTPGETKLHKLYIHPEWQRRGLGGQLLAHVEEDCRRRGDTTLILAVNKANHKALAMYRTHGFQVRNAVVVEIGQGFVMNDYVLEKRL